MPALITPHQPTTVVSPYGNGPWRSRMAKCAPDTGRDAESANRRRKAYVLRGI
jgi:hypothetical protein